MMRSGGLQSGIALEDGSRLMANEARKKGQAEKSFDGLTCLVYRTLLGARIANAEDVSRIIRDAFTDFPNWRRSESAMRELRKKVTFAIFAETEGLNAVSALVNELFSPLEKANRLQDSGNGQAESGLQAPRPGVGCEAGRCLAGRVPSQPSVGVVATDPNSKRVSSRPARNPAHP